MNKTDVSQLLTLRQFSARYPAFPLRYLQYLVATNKDNFTDAVVVRLGKKILLDVESVNAWVGEKRKVTTVKAEVSNGLGNATNS